MGKLEQRLKKIEQKILMGKPRVLILYPEYGETEADCLERLGIDLEDYADDTLVMIFSFSPDEACKSAPSKAIRERRMPQVGVKNYEPEKAIEPCLDRKEHELDEATRIYEDLLGGGMTPEQIESALVDMPNDEQTPQRDAFDEEAGRKRAEHFRNPRGSKTKWSNLFH